MNLTIIGATRGTGQRVMEQALLLGHKVTALARRPEVIGLKHPNLTVRQGDVYKPDTLEPVIAGQDVIISSLGLRDPKSFFQIPTIYSIGTGNVIKAMEACGVKRLIVITSSGVIDDPTEPGWYRYVLKPLLLEKAYTDMRRLEDKLQQTALDWISVRPGYLTNGPLTCNYRVGLDKWPEGGWKISRADVANFILNQLNDNRYLRSGPIILY